MKPEKLRVYVLSGADLGRSFAIGAGAAFGRSPDGVVVLRDASISRVHAKVERRGDALWLVDQASRNGVFVEGKKVPELALADAVEF